MQRRSRLPAPVMAVLATGTLDSLGASIVSLAVIWLLTGLTHSAAELGLFFMIIELPYLLLLVPAGIWADRANRRRLALAVLALRILATLAIAWLAHLHHLAWFVIALAVVAQEAASAVLQPALGAWLFGMTPPEEFAALSGWQQAGGNLATLLGPTLGGILVAVAGIPATIAAGALAGLANWLGIAMNRRPERPRADAAQGAGVSAGFSAGWRFVRQSPGMLSMVLFFSATNGLNDVEAVLVPLLARLVLHLAAWQFGLLSTAFGVGGILGAFGGVRLDGRSLRKLPWAFGAMAVFGVAIVAMGFALNAWWLGISYFVLGLSFATTEVVTNALWQRMVPDDVRGRVMSTMSTLARIANPIGYAFAGWLGAALGIREGLWIGGGAIILLAALMVLSRSVRALEGSLAGAADPRAPGSPAAP